ncbi:MAG: DUF5110 domain-containing protein [Vicinamibacteria bacterium]|nr:DUF5110 domain-containing protein [Vicinamibacteria bacterium]
MRSSTRLVLGLVFCFSSASMSAPAGRRIQRQDDGVVITIGDRHLKLQVCRERVFRVLYAPDDGFFDRETLMIQGSPCGRIPWDLRVDEDAVALSTSKLTARINLSDGAVSFLNSEGRTLLAERLGGGMSFTPAEIQGESTRHVRAEFEPSGGEGFYGLGQHQNGFMNYSGRDVDLFQQNIVASVPFLVSSRGYGLLWDNTSHTKFGDLRAPVLIPSSRLHDASGNAGGLTGNYHQGDCSGPVVATRIDAAIDFGAPEGRPPFSEVHSTPQATNQDLHPALKSGDACVVWEGAVESEKAGEYDLVTFANNGLRLWFDGRLEVDTWRQGWLAWTDVARVRLDAGKRYPIRIEWSKNQDEGTLRLKWKTPPARYPYASIWSEVGDGVDYYFIYGPELDDVVAGYRELTGRAPIMPRWAYGLWQSRERYETARQSLDVMEEFRRRRIPIDNIVQDWRYWREAEWGSHRFDPERFPDPAGWIRDLHERHKARLMISVWPKFYKGISNFEELHKRGFLYPGTIGRGTVDWLGHVHTFYDAFNPEARRLFWEQMNRELFSKGVDAWWMDATEPEMVNEGTAESLKATMHPTAMGSGSRMANAFALVSSQAVYEGQRGVAPDRRVFILTRSAFAGIQRYASATWSGDVSSDWTALAKQVPAGLNFSLSGIPYWTVDIGGFAAPPKWSRPDSKPEDVEEWRELFTRWFQFGTFCPLFRVHGQFPHREMWFFGDENHRAYRTQLEFDRLRYRMLPYIYSLGSRVTRRHDTIMRALVMDFRDDSNVLDIGDQYMFGPALLVNPVTRKGAESREVYLPKIADWYDFWTGKRLEGGQTINAFAPYEFLPVYVRAGSILPMGPELQHTEEKPADPITLWVYEGADASFELYEDEGVNYNYERDVSATIPLIWDEENRTLTIGARAGSFPGMLEERTFRVVFVSSDQPLGHTAEPKTSHVVRYDGRETVIGAR